MFTHDSASQTTHLPTSREVVGYDHSSWTAKLGRFYRRIMALCSRCSLLLNILVSENPNESSPNQEPNNTQLPQGNQETHQEHLRLQLNIARIFDLRSNLDDWSPLMAQKQHGWTHLSQLWLWVSTRSLCRNRVKNNARWRRVWSIGKTCASCPDDSQNSAPSRKHLRLGWRLQRMGLCCLASQGTERSWPGW